jgi:hypothetical protein
MLIQVGMFTAMFVLAAMAVGLLLLPLLLPCGQHAGAGDGALSVARLEEEATREARARAAEGKHRAMTRSAWTEPVVALAA